MTSSSKGWPEKRRIEQSLRCKQNKPWKNSTGPRTEDGKSRMKDNPLKHGLRSKEGVELRKLMNAQRAFLKMLEQRMRDK